MDSISYNIDEFELPSQGSNNKELLEGIDETFNIETLIIAFYFISRLQNQEIFNTRQYILALLYKLPCP